MNYYSFFWVMPNGISIPAQFAYNPIPKTGIWSSNTAIEVNQLVLQKELNSQLILTLDSQDVDKITPLRAVQRKKSILKEKDQSFKWRYQNKDRNILSNILRSFFNYITEQQGMHSYLIQLYEINFLPNGVSGLFQFLKINNFINKSYVSPRVVKDLLKNSCHHEIHAKVLKFALKKFLKEDFKLLLIKSSKIKIKSKLYQMKKARQLVGMLFSK